MKRPFYIQQIASQLRVHPACGLLGPRQVGKTTLAKMFLEEERIYDGVFFDLENPIDLARMENPMLSLSPIKNSLIVIDEVQRRPDLFPTLRVLLDQKEKNNKYLILGSASRELIRQSSETLAGRLGYVELMPFALDEMRDAEKLWLRGGFPPSLFAQTEEDSYLWRESYITSFLERDIPSLGFSLPPEQLRRFWIMLAHHHGQIFNASEIGKSLGVSHTTVRRYLDILMGTFMVRQLAPWHENISKRQVKSPKIYLRDSGILHALLGIRNHDSLSVFPKIGAFWEGFALEEVIRHFHATREECYFWATQSGAELDLLLMKDGKKLGFEFKYADAPKITASMKIALADLALDHLTIVYPGNQSFPMQERISAMGLSNFCST